MIDASTARRLNAMNLPRGADAADLFEEIGEAQLRRAPSAAAVL